MYTYTPEILESKTIDELRFLLNQAGLRPKGDRRRRTSYIKALVGTPLPLFAELVAQELPNDLCNPGAVAQELPNDLCNPGAVAQELPNDLCNPVTFSDSFLRKFSPPVSQRIYFFDEDGNALGLWAYSETDTEAPDPDDFANINEFWAAMDTWNAENDPPLLADLDSLVLWAPCPWEWYEPESSPEPEPEIPRRCPCGAVPIELCNGEKATIVLPDQIYIIPCYRRFFNPDAARPPPLVGVLR
jgi:hypothetical protein